MSEQLALLGGKPVIEGELAPYRSVGEKEEAAVIEVIRSGCLSGFYGSPGPEFLGGPKVRAFEDAWKTRYGVKHAVSVNSATSGLSCAAAAVGISPGDEVICPPWTMSATVITALTYGGIPVFADIDEDTFCIDPKSVASLITAKTRAVVAVNLFGHPAPLAELRALCDKHGIYLIEDNAQAPIASEHGRATGTIGHIGVFSLNYHKHIHTGEGGICVTADDTLAARMQLVRNHGENVTSMLPDGDLTNMVGFNLRLSEMAAAVGLVQLSDVDRHVEKRERIAEALTEGTKDLDGWIVPKVREGCRHNYYQWVVRYDAAAVGVSRELFAKALTAEGFPIFPGYVAPLYRLPVFRERKAIGRDGWPFTLTDRTYQDGLCPVTERLHAEEAMLFEPCAYAVDDDLLERLVAAVRKVHAGRGQLNAIAGKAAQ